MKRKIIVLALLTTLGTVAALAACNSQASSTTGTTKNPALLSGEARLLVGTFKLEDTDLAVSSEQAKQLLPLWQTLLALSTSNTTAREEVNAVVDQIESSLTAEQMDKITAMKLTQQDMMSIMSQAGVSPNGASATTTPMALNGLPGSGGSQGAGGGPGGGPAGGPPAGGPPAGGFPGGGDPGIAGGVGGASVTPQAVRPGMGNQVPPPLLNALIQLLQKKIK